VLGAFEYAGFQFRPSIAGASRSLDAARDTGVTVARKRRGFIRGQCAGVVTRGGAGQNRARDSRARVR
jgi:hypothetical protein